ncbi:MAG: formylglycine-generating enzyme family protein [Bacteroidales bacterium]|nr:formylglycine-generating enzyme family protein [Bacteroidales bacterium]MCB9013960.1 formylglycine-generating enzyme family protein [Bacteroidales bacterium]
MKLSKLILLFSFLILFAFSCSFNRNAEDGASSIKKDSSVYCLPAADKYSLITGSSASNSSVKPKDMQFIPGGVFHMGARDKRYARPDEFPVHKVRLSSFYMDKHEVTNHQFKEFVDSTGYITIAERKIDWEEMKKSLPPGTPKPSDESLAPGSMQFNPPDHPVPLDNAMIWWSWAKGYSWKTPEGPGSSIVGKEDFPVVHIAWLDAKAYADWAGKSLPTEAQWEYAARGGNDENIYPWGQEEVDIGSVKANTWQGNFPNNNSLRDGFYGLAPAMSFEPNGYGLYDMAGNVWEWCQDWYNYDYYSTFKNIEIADNPTGPDTSYDPMEPHAQKKTIRGGSYLCNYSYCSGFRAAARMKSTPDSGAPHIGFRCVINSVE